MSSMLVRCRRLGVLVASLSVLLVSFVASASAQDLAVTKHTESTVVAAGTNVSFDVTVSNSTGSTGQTTLTDEVPDNMTFVSASFPESWTCNLPTVGSDGTIVCTHPGDIPDETVYSFTFVFQVVPGTPNGTVIVNTATIDNAADSISSNNMSMDSVTVGDPPPPPPPPLVSKDVLISEFRLSGPGVTAPNGAHDDFIELYCNRDTNCDISGATLRGYDTVNQGDFSMTFPGQTIIPARHYLLVADSRGYSLGGYGFPDIDVALSQPPPPTPPDPPPPPFYFYDNEGIQLVTSGDPVVLDSVGFTGGGNDFIYIEGNGLERASARPSDQYAYVRKRTMTTAGLPQDTDDNAADFVLVSVTGNQHSGITAPPVLGAPGPQGLDNHITYSNSQVVGALVDPDKSKEQDPNRVRDGSGDSGTLSIRRSFTNATTEIFDDMRFRVIEISTLNSPNTLGDQAQLRLITSTGTSADVPSRGFVPIEGTALEYDNICGCPEPKQPNGGGLNSTVYINFTEASSIFPSQTVDVQFLLSVVKSGLYRFFVYVEAYPRQTSELTPELKAGPGPSRFRGKPPTPRKFASAQRLPVAGPAKATQRTPVITSAVRPVTTAVTPVATTNASPAKLPTTTVTTPRMIIINRLWAEGEKKPRKKTRVRRKNSAALKKKAEERFAAEKPQN